MNGGVFLVPYWIFQPIQSSRHLTGKGFQMTNTDGTGAAGPTKAATSPDLRIHIGVNIAVSLLVLWITIPLGHGLKFYPSTHLFPGQVAITLAAGVAALVFRRYRYPLALISSYNLVALGLGWDAGGTGIPGGDDGTGMRWFFEGGLVCVASYFIGAATLLTMVRKKAKSLPQGSGPRLGHHLIVVLLAPMATFFFMGATSYWTAERDRLPRVDRTRLSPTTMKAEPCGSQVTRD
jgi:hypothetical protein